MGNEYVYVRDLSDELLETIATQCIANYHFKTLLICSRAEINHYSEKLREFSSFCKPIVIRHYEGTQIIFNHNDSQITIRCSSNADSYRGYRAHLIYCTNPLFDEDRLICCCMSYDSSKYYNNNYINLNDIITDNESFTNLFL